MMATLRDAWRRLEWCPPKRPYEELDPLIADLVHTMNATGQIKTIASCQGHPLRHGPYVYFCAPLDIAVELARQLEHAHRGGRLNYVWTLEGVFHDDELRFRLQAPAFDSVDKGNSFWKGFLTLWLDRSSLNADIALVGTLVRASVEQATPVLMADAVCDEAPNRRIAGLVDALKVKGGFHILGSCPGHVFKSAEPPHVHFSGTVALAAGFQSQLFAAEGAGILHRYWHLETRFTEEYAVFFSLNAPKYSREADGFWYRVLHFAVWRRPLDQDIQTLTDLLLAAVREDHASNSRSLPCQ